MHSYQYDAVVEERATPESFHRAMRKAAWPVTIVTARTPSEDGASSEPRARGMTCTSFVSLSLKPPLVAFSVAMGSQMDHVLQAASYFAVHLLGDDQAPLADHFARPGQTSDEQFEQAAHREGPGGTPLLENARVVLLCRRVNDFEAGANRHLTGQVEHIYHDRSSGPLLYYQRTYHGLGEL